MRKKVYIKEEKTLSIMLINLFFDFATAFQDKIKQREQSVLEKWVKTCPADEFSPSCEKARKSVSYKLCVCTTVNILCGAKCRFFTAVGY